MDSSILMAPSRIQGRNKRAARKVGIRRPVSFCASLPSHNRNTSIKDRTILRKTGSLPVDVMDDASAEGSGSDKDDGSVQSFSHLANVTVSVHDENTPLQNLSHELIADEVQSCDEIDTGISCCAFDMYDSFFFQSGPECPRQGDSSSRSNSSCDELTTRIECILEEEYAEGKKEPPMVEVKDVTIPQRQTGGRQNTS